MSRTERLLGTAEAETGFALFFSENLTSTAQSVVLTGSHEKCETRK